LSKGGTGCFFLDTCILISEILNEKNEKIEKFKKDALSNKIPCYFSDSVENETQKKVTDTINYIGSSLKDIILTHLTASRRRRRKSISDPIDNDDIKALEDLFNTCHSTARASGLTLPNPLVHIETWVISYLSDVLAKGMPMSINYFIKELVKSVLTFTIAIQNAIDYLITYQQGFVKKQTVASNVALSVAINNAGIHNPDNDHIASAITYQSASSTKTIFVTLDFTTILRRRKSIHRNFGIECSDPLYAFHHL
jgi:hypothetical protein